MQALALPKPYTDDSANDMYNLLFCDNLDLFKEKMQAPYTYPFDLLFSESATADDLKKITEDKNADPRVKILACNRLTALGHKPETKELLAVIVELGLDEGLDTLASFYDGTARYINQTGKILVWETTVEETANAITHELFARSRRIVSQIGPWDKPRRPAPAKDMLRISFLVSDGLYFGEGPIDALFRDPMAGAALSKATELLQYITKLSVSTGQ